jgi:hypothetical protein
LAGFATPAAEDARVEVLLRAEQFQFKVGDAPQAVGDRRHAGGELARIADDDAVAGELLGILLEKRLQVLAADLLFAFDQQLHLQRQFAGGR